MVELNGGTIYHENEVVGHYEVDQNTVRNLHIDKEHRGPNGSLYDVLSELYREFEARNHNHLIVETLGSEPDDVFIAAGFTEHEQGWVKQL